MVLNVMQNWVKMIPKWSPPPIPIPGVSKSLLPGGKINIKKHILLNLNDLYEKINPANKNNRRFLERVQKEEIQE